jgi:hypothetical protein
MARKKAALPTQQSAPEPVQAAVETAVEPPSPAQAPKIVPPDQFFAILRDYPDPTATATYIYRLWPIIDRTVSDPKSRKYIDKVGDPIDMAYLLRTWGSGKYRLIFNDENRPMGKKQVMRTDLEIVDPECPPYIENLDEIDLEHKENRTFVAGLRQRGILPPAPGPAPPATPEGSAVAALSRIALDQVGRPQSSAAEAKAIDVIAEASKRAVNMAFDQARPVDPIEQAIRLKELFKVDDNSKLLALLIESQNKREELMLRLFDKPKESGSLEATLGFMEKMMSLGEKLANRAGSKSSTLQTVLEYLPGILNPIANGVSALVAARTGQIPAAAPPSGEVGAVTPAPAPAIVRQFGARLVRALEDGMDGCSFAHGLAALAGVEVYEAVEALGKPGILAALQSVPDVWALLAPRSEQLGRFIDEFLSYGREDEPADGDSQAAAAAKEA